MNNIQKFNPISGKLDYVPDTRMPANSVKSNNTNTTNQMVDVGLTPNSVLGRVSTINSGNIAPIPIREIATFIVTLIDGTATIFDTRFTTASQVFVMATNIGVLSAIPLRSNVSVAGQCTISNGQIGDTAVINVLAYF